MSEPVFVTALGIVSGIGIGAEKTLASLHSRTSGVGKLKYLNTLHKEIPCSEVQLSDTEMKKILQISDDEIVTRNSLLGILAAKEAYEKAHLHDCKEKGLRIGFLNGTTVGGMEKSEQYYYDFLNPDAHEFDGYIEAHDCGACSEKIADYLDDFDYVSTISTACSSAVNTLILGNNLIKAGILDCVIAGGTECLSLFHLNGFKTLMILDNQQCRPFDANRAGLNLGEGAAFLVLESEKAMKLRQSKPICTIAGWGNSCDAFHQTASSPDGKGAILSMQKALAMSELNLADIDYVNAHGTGTLNNDESEGAALMNIFGEQIPPVSSTKSFTGHTTSAAGCVESVICLLAMQHNFLPPNLLFQNKIENLNFIPIKEEIQNIEVNHILNNSFGFGGNNSSIIFSKIK